MILFITSYDEATKSNLDVVKQVTKESKEKYNKLFSKDATRDKLLNRLKNNKDNSLLLMSHGCENHVYFQNENGEELFAVSMNDASLFKDRSVFSYSCKTGKQLGKHLSSKNGIYFGYYKTICAPNSDGLFVQLFAEIFECIISEFPEVQTDDDINNFMFAIKSKIKDEIEPRIQELEKKQRFHVPLEVYVALDSIWRFLVTWINGRLIDPFSNEAQSFPGFN
jgi:hypothetical protein